MLVNKALSHGIDPAIHKNKVLSFVRAQMNLEDIMLTETSQAQQDKLCTSSLNAGRWKADLMENESRIMATRG